jgi:NADPH-dependent curcumin reductase CurA
LAADFAADWLAALTRLSSWLTDETITPAVQLWHGLDSAPEALVAVLAGESFGQAVVRLAEDPTSSASGQ